MNCTFGPVPSRRLGYSLGINHIPPKHCPYSCVYCQVGRTNLLQINRRAFYPIDEILLDVQRKVSESYRIGRSIDFLTFVPDGEPTLDIHLGALISNLKSFGIPIAVISNGALIDREDVQEDLLQADWVSLKVDAVVEQVWRRINRPHHDHSLTKILEGMLRFRGRFMGELVTETMLVAGINDELADLDHLSDFLIELQPLKSYLAIPTRPPAETSVIPPPSETLKNIVFALSRKVSFIDLLFDEETTDFVSTGNLVEDILAILSVHPLREKNLQQILERANATWEIVDELLSTQTIARIVYRNERFYIRSFPTNFHHPAGKQNRPQS